MDLPRKLSTGEAVMVFVILAVLFLVLWPMAVRHRPISTASNCPSNIQQIGRAIKTYLTDWDDTYPTNRRWASRGKLGPITDQVKLSPAETDKEGNPIRFRRGVNWVEGLYPYIEAIYGQADSASAWRCPTAREEVYPAGSQTAAVTYAFNRNLVEKPENEVRSANCLLMVREMERCVESVLRPTNDSNRKPSAPPVSPFLNTTDARMGRTKADLHARGSHVLFADGHIKLFEIDYFPPQKHYTRGNCWDTETGQWYNYSTKTNLPDRFEKSIAITP